MEILKDLGFDVVSGILTTVIIFVITVFTKYWLLPFIKRIKYNGANISGDWYCHLEHGNATYDYTLTIKQNAHELEGNAKIFKRYNGAIDYNQEFIISGLIYEGYVILNLKSANNSILSLSTGIFQLQNRGSLLSGILSYRVRIGDGVSSENVSFERE